MSFFKFHEARFIQEVTFTSAADALFVSSAAVPANKSWTILCASYQPSAGETRTLSWLLAGRSTFQYAISVPVSIALTVSTPFPLVTEGMEITLYPGEYLKVQRDAATAASTMNLKMRVIETDLPYFEYADPLMPIVSQAHHRTSVVRSSGSGTLGAGRAAPAGGRGGGGGGSEPY